ncbi:MAG TPA: glycine cleavage system aminomethyltransferase GcvT [Verrucomicrobiae bacterium]|nr:glycine cleavage system aminomethyltransferase GcvT [Verrucomicrobiae bacterium]
MHGTASLKRTPLYAAHVGRGAKMVSFGGWEMPACYTGIIDEHTAVRARVGLFDISHMGEFLVAGPNAEATLNVLLTNDLCKTSVGQGQYTLLCNDTGGIIDDLIAYRVEPSVFLLVVNAANIEKDFTWMNVRTTKSIVLDNLSDQMAAVALQGPAATNVLPEAQGIPHFGIARLGILSQQCWVARTGYTGEDGFEIVCDAGDARTLWSALLERGQPFGIKPCGLGARDTLRLEMGYPLHGNDITEATTPLEAGLNKFVSFDKGDFIGRATLSGQRTAGVKRKLVAFKMTDKSPPPRPHYLIYVGDRTVGEITSGTQSPSLGTGVGLGYVEAGVAHAGTAIEIEIRGRRFPAVVEQKPLLKRNI